MYCDSANAYKTRTLIKMETLPLVWTNHWSWCGHDIKHFHHLP